MPWVLGFSVFGWFVFFQSLSPELACSVWSSASPGLMSDGQVLRTLAYRTGCPCSSLSRAFSFSSHSISPRFPEPDPSLSCCHLNPLVHVVPALREAGSSCWAPPLFFLVLVGVSPPSIQLVNPPAISLSPDHIASSCPNAVWLLPVPGISLPPEYLCF